MLEEAFKNIAEERDKLEAYAKQIQNKSKEVERLSKVRNRPLATS